jgi:hypothetical protein
MDLRVENAEVDEYKTFLKEPGRPPSQGGNTAALHSHVLTIAGEVYSFLALGSRKWVFAGDLVSFAYEVKGINGKVYKNVLRETLISVDRSGKEVVRGNRGFKKQLRTVAARLPGSRRERRG